MLLCSGCCLKYFAFEERSQLDAISRGILFTLKSKLVCYISLGQVFGHFRQLVVNLNIMVKGKYDR